MLPKLRFVSWGCSETGRYSEVTRAHVHDGGICVLERNVRPEMLLNINSDDRLVPATLTLHEYAHIIAPNEYHHHGLLWQAAYRELCSDFKMEPGIVDCDAGDWSVPIGTFEALEQSDGWHSQIEPALAV